jgi:hypothetical protein
MMMSHQWQKGYHWGVGTCRSEAGVSKHSTKIVQYCADRIVDSQETLLTVKVDARSTISLVNKVLRRILAL